MSVLAKNLLTLDQSTSPAHSIRSAERSTLVADVLRNQAASGQIMRMRMKVRGESMLPVLWPGQVVEIENCSMSKDGDGNGNGDTFQPGDIVLALRNGRLFLHRLLVRKADGFQLRGDSMPGPDPIFPHDALIGRLVADSGTTRTSRKFVRTSSRIFGLILCYCGPARRLALALHRRRTNSATFFSHSESSAELETL
jgi:hypothetical protein